MRYQSREFQSSFEELIVAVITLMVLTKFSHFAFLQKKNLQNYFSRNFALFLLHLFLRNSRKSLQKATESFRMFSRTLVSTQHNPLQAQINKSILYCGLCNSRKIYMLVWQYKGLVKRMRGKGYWLVQEWERRVTDLYKNEWGYCCTRMREEGYWLVKEWVGILL